jgi:nitrate reductase gamma subunit
MTVTEILFGIIVPYAALAVFLAGSAYRLCEWARIPVPFCVPTVCGQQKSLPWIQGDGLESPATTRGVWGRMLLETCLFRSLFRNDRARLKADAGSMLYVGNKFLWLGGLVFHVALLIILLRHLKFFLEPIPSCVLALQSLDGLFQWGTPAILMSDKLILLGLLYLLLRRIFLPPMRYISLPSDYFALCLILGIVVSGVTMRHFYKVDLVEAKQFVLGMARFSPALPGEMGLLFYVHLFLVSSLAAYFPFSKLMHAGGLFFSPTRNLANNSRARRHLNPWNYPVKVHTYQEYEDEFRDAMKEVGLPVEKKISGGPEGARR